MTEQGAMIATTGRPAPGWLDLLVAVIGQPDIGWMTGAACGNTGADGDQFFPEKGESLRPAKAICAGCPVQIECKKWARQTGEPFGIWGGEPERVRGAVRTGRPTGRTHCERGGHPFTPENTRESNGRRICLVCEQERFVERTRARLQAGAA